MDINLDNTYWDKLKGYVTELRVDSRWVLRGNDDDLPYGSLRIVSHPDLPPGYLRAHFSIVSKKREKTMNEIIQTIEDYQMDKNETEVYSVKDKIETDDKTYEAPLRELEKLFDVKIF